MRSGDVGQGSVSEGRGEETALWIWIKNAGIGSSFSCQINDSRPLPSMTFVCVLPLAQFPLILGGAFALVLPQWEPAGIAGAPGCRFSGMKGI